MQGRVSLKTNHKHFDKKATKEHLREFPVRYISRLVLPPKKGNSLIFENGCSRSVHKSCVCTRIKKKIELLPAC